MPSAFKIGGRTKHKTLQPTPNLSMSVRQKKPSYLIVLSEISWAACIEGAAGLAGFGSLVFWIWLALK